LARLIQPALNASFETIASVDFHRRDAVLAIPQDEGGGC